MFVNKQLFTFQQHHIQTMIFEKNQNNNKNMCFKPFSTHTCSICFSKLVSNKNKTTHCFKQKTKHVFQKRVQHQSNSGDQKQQQKQIKHKVQTTKLRMKQKCSTFVFNKYNSDATKCFKTKSKTNVFKQRSGVHNFRWAAC